jgi:ATPase subunit of ABC transporter with duplicated ATPase domains
MLEITLKNIEKAYGIQIVLTKFSMEVNKGDRIGIIGTNGCGKTTVFKIIAGIEDYDTGIMSARKDLTIGYLDQIPQYHGTVEQHLQSAFVKLNPVIDEMNHIEHKMSNPDTPPKELERCITGYGKLQEEFERLGGYRMEEQINRICHGLKISDEMRRQMFDTLSGGESTTASLGRILLQNPDILLLDEPTNHLDIESVEWLEEYLKTYEGTVLIISHDRYFLDKTVNQIIEIENGESKHYAGNYSYYLEEKDRILLSEFERYKDQQKKIKAMKESIERYKVWSKNGQNEKMYKKVKQLEKRLAKMELIEKPMLERKKIQLGFNPESRSGKIAVEGKHIGKSYQKGKELFSDADLLIRYKERISLLGKNGSGKSTLFKMITGEVDEYAGELKLGSNLKIGYLSQEIEFPNEKETILQSFINSTNMLQREARSALASFMFYADEVFKRVEDLSGGERVRLRLCELMHHDVNMLILDEPTNHLDIDSREMLEDALSAFDGTLLFISHDRYFINKLAERVLEIDDGELKDYPGNYEYYKRKRENSFDKQKVL